MMKQRFTLYLTLLIMVFAIRTTIAQPWDYLDVPEGYETLNLAVEGDTTSTGEVKSLNRVYRLERGGTYLLNGTVVNLMGSPLRIIAAEGSGPKPILIMAVDETGDSDEPFNVEGDAHFKDLYISGSDMLGNDNRYGILIYGNGVRVVIDNVNLDFADQAHVKTYGKDCKIYHYNCEFRNGFLLTDQGRGRFFDARGLMPDSLVYINNTFYVNKHRILRFDGAMGANIILDHNTFYLNAYGGEADSPDDVIDGPIELHRGINVRVTNNIFQDIGMEAVQHPPGMEVYDTMPIIPVDTVYAPAYPEESRHWVVRNNVYGWSPSVQAFWASMSDSVKAPAFISPWGMDHYFGGHKPNFIAENNFEEFIEFSDAPSPDAMLNFVKYRYASRFSDENNPDFRADRNGTGTLENEPETFGPEDDPYNFDYSSDHAAYTAADGEFPAGDLNWFPDKKAEWEVYVTGVKTGKKKILTDYTLEQNYPNPFNPTTRISYTLPKATKVTLSIYNALGQKVTTLLDQKKQTAGKHSMTWNAINSSGTVASTGVYYYQLRADDVRITKKMILVK
jgi:hypothetical protein